MAGFSGGDAIGAGFRLIRREPVAFLVWTLLYLVVHVLPMGWMMAEVFRGIGPLMEATRDGAEPALDDMFAFQARILRFQGLYYLLTIVTQTLLFAAIYRASLGTEPRGVFHLSLGSRELWLGLVILVLYVLLFIGFIVVMIPMLIVFGVAAAATQNEALAWFAPLVMLAGFAVVLWGALRLSMAPIMSFQENTFRLFESWSLTRGHALKMFGVAVALVVILWIAQLVLAAAAFGALFSQIPLQTFADADPNAPFEVFERLGVGFWIAIGVGVALLGTFFTVLFGAAWAEIYRGLTSPENAPAA